jgi:hypothetical protein
MDVYIPSLPDMAAQLQTTPAAIQLTLSLFIISYGVSQLIVGGLLDSYGRYWPTMISMLVFSASSFAPPAEDTMPMSPGMDEPAPSAPARRAPSRKGGAKKAAKKGGAKKAAKKSAAKKGGAKKAAKKGGAKSSGKKAAKKSAKKAAKKSGARRR